MVKKQHPQAVKEAGANVIPIWLEAFKVLNMDPRNNVAKDSIWEGLAVRIQKAHSRLIPSRPCFLSTGTGPCLSLL
ncbi:hypothetical protein BT96DRAFT_404936 [Gymnopus androsaceus JB14]|uniref:Uncharacterized protein n=1 Tax=Gymnopus androsaceus JB14 TaxID=1447944 RepID=A0A6A4I1X2_9AGAR|nr:hypothetical protein BT96DRAFT_404936 [Gymnopus androsaceus JB14]